MGEISIIRSVTRQVHRVSPVDFSDNGSEADEESHVGITQDNGRPYGGPAYRTANSVARRLFLRSAHCVRTPSESTLFAEHTANTRNGGGSINEEEFEMKLAPAAATPRLFNVSVLAGDDIYREERALNAERKVLLSAINSTRQLAKLPPVALDDEFTHRVQSYANVLEDVDVLPAAFRRLLNSPTIQTTISREELHSATEHGVRVMSPPGLGAIAVGELWLGGKYKAHGDMFPQRQPMISLAPSILRRIHHSAMNYPMVPPTSPFYQTRSPGKEDTPPSDSSSPQTSHSSPYLTSNRLTNPFTDMTNLPRDDTDGSLKTILPPKPEPEPEPEPEHDEEPKRCECIQPDIPGGCPCHLFEVYHILVDPRWTEVGIGLTQDHRWIVEFADGKTDRKVFEGIRGWETIQ